MELISGILTPTHDVTAFRLAILLACSLGAFTLAAELHLRWFRHRNSRVLSVYCAVLSCCIAWGAVDIPVGELLPETLRDFLLSIPLGTVIGIASADCDRRILRRSHRNSVRDVRSWTRDGGKDGDRVAARNIVFVGNFRHDTARARTAAVVASQPAPTTEALNREFTPALAVLVAVLEELLHRGLLVEVASLLRSALALTICLVLLTAAFCLSHIWFGWAHVLAKVPLATMCLVSVLLTRHVTPAVVAHVCFNLIVVRRMRSAESPQVVRSLSSAGLRF